MEYRLGSIFQSLDMNYSNGLTDETDGNITVFQNYFFLKQRKN